MEIIRAEELAQRYDELIERVSADERIIVSHAGKQIALVSFDDLTFLEDVDRKLDERDSDVAKARLADKSQVASPFVPSTSASHSSHE